MTKLSLIFAYLLLCNIAHAQPAAYWCDAPWPPPAGSDRTMGKDSDGNTCIKISRPVEKDCPKQPVINAYGPSGMTEWDYRMYQDGYKQKAKKVGNQLHVYYEK